MILFSPGGNQCCRKLNKKRRLESHWLAEQRDTVYTRGYSPRSRARNFGKIESLSESVLNCATCAIYTVSFANATRLNALAAIQMRRVARIAEGKCVERNASSTRASCVKGKKNRKEEKVALKQKLYYSKLEN